MTKQYRIKIKEIKTNIEKEYTEEWCNEISVDSNPEFYWSEGNFACDCNRKMLFYDDEELKSNETPCGDAEYKVELRTMNGDLIYSDMENKNA